jgi:phage baseplate assembly protein W
MAEAKSYSFKSVGEKTIDYNTRARARITEPPIGIKTPIEIGSTDDGLLKMHRSLADQIKDNFRNLILTNKNERLAFPDFGANLTPLAFELGTEDADEEAMRRIKSAAEKYMPFISLEDFSLTNEISDTGATALIKMLITYSVPTANIANQNLLLTMRFGG